MVELAVALTVLVAVVGTIVPLLPGPALVALGVVIYAFWAQEYHATVTAVVVLAVLALGLALKWIVPARTVSGDVQRWPLVIGGVLGLVGFFVVPVVGLPLGFVLGVFVTEAFLRRSLAEAWPATKVAVTAAGLQLLMELAAVIIAGGVWLTSAVIY